MSSLAFCAAPIEDSYNIQNNNNNNKTKPNKRQKHNKIRNNSLNPHNTGKNKKVQAMIDEIHQNLENSSEENEFADFNPMPENNSVHFNNSRPTTPTPDTVVRTGTPGDTYGGPPAASSFSSLETAEPQAYLEDLDIAKYTDKPKTIQPIFKATNNTLNTKSMQNTNDNTSKNYEEIMRKLNYLVHLLEEQQDHKTGHVAEEVILYSFLGIFIIFVVDSFAQAGKYVR